MFYEFSSLKLNYATINSSKKDRDELKTSILYLFSYKN
jgi:hypothetical protein